MNYRRERITTPDEDFLDLDWSRRRNTRLTILCHGLEGSTDASYMKGMVRVFNRSGWDTLGINARNDPFLAPSCYPVKQARQSAWLYLEIPATGGHVGFIPPRWMSDFWHERRILAFAESQTGPLASNT